ncbi:MAG: glycosyl transferase family 1, partial [Bacteroidetes bacterium]
AIQQAHFSTLPTLGENFGHAIFEGLLAGLPVLISDRTPWRGLEAREIGWDLPLEQPEAFVRAIQQAVDMDQETYDRWSRKAWEYARDFKNDPALLEQTRALFV